MGFSFKSIFERIHTLNVPTSGTPLKVYFLAVLNFCLFGWGTIISGIANQCYEDVVIGILQFIIPFVGWVWSVGWGLLMASRKFKQSRFEDDVVPSPITEP